MHERSSTCVTLGVKGLMAASGPGCMQVWDEDSARVEPKLAASLKDKMQLPRQTLAAKQLAAAPRAQFASAPWRLQLALVAHGLRQQGVALPLDAGAERLLSFEEDFQGQGRGRRPPAAGGVGGKAGSTIKIRGLGGMVQWLKRP